MANRYWVGGTGTWDTTSTTNWSASSGGASGASVPTAADSVFFDQAGTYTVTMTGALACLDITVSAGTVTFAHGTTPTLSVAGSMTLLAGTVWNSTGTITFTSTTTGRTVTTNGVTINGNVTFNGAGGGWTLLSALTLSSLRTATLSQGTLSLSTFTLTAGFFSVNSASVRLLAFGTGNITVNGAGGTLWNAYTVTNLSTSGSRVVNVSYSGVSTVIITLGSLNEANSISFNFTTGGYTLALSAGSFRDLNFTGFSGSVSTGGNLAIYGNANLGSTATFSTTTRTWVFASTTAGRTITSNGRTLNVPVFFSGLGGSWVLQDAMTVSATQTTTLDAGTLNLNNFTLTTGFFVATGSFVRSIAFGTGSITVNGAGGTLWTAATSSSLTVSGTPVVNVTYAGAVATTVSTGSLSEANSISFNFTAGTYTLTMTATGYRNISFIGFAGTVAAGNIASYGNLTLSTGMTFASTTSFWTFSGTSGTKTITTNGKSMPYVVTINASGATYQLGGAFTSTVSNLTLTAGTLNTTASNYALSVPGISVASSASAILTLNGSTVNISGGTLTLGALSVFNAGTSQINIAGSAATITASKTFYNVTYTSTLSGNRNVTGACVFNTFRAIAPSAGIATVSFSENQTMATFSVLGTAANQRLFFRSSTLGTARTITLTNPATVANCDFRDMSFSSTVNATNGGGNCGNNTNVTFPAAKTVYWVPPGISHSWSSSAGWAASSGGAASTANFPLAQDTAVFDDTTPSGLTVALDYAWNIGSFTSLGRTGSMTFNTGGFLFSIYGNFLQGSTTSVAGTQLMTFAGTGLQMINGAFTQPTTIQKPSGSVTLVGAATFTSTFGVTLTSGGLALQSYTLTTTLFSSSNSNTRSIAFGTGNITLNGAGGTLWTTATTTGLTTSGTQVVNVSYTGASATTITPGSLSEANSISFNYTAGTYTSTLSGTARSLNYTGFSGTVTNSGINVIYGNLNLGSTATFSFVYDVRFAATSTGNTITCNGRIISTSSSINFNGIGGSWILQDALTLAAGASVQLSTGTLDLNGKTLTVGTFTSDNSNTRTLAFGTGSITVRRWASSQACWNTNTVTGLTVTGTPVVNVSYSTFDNTTISSGPLTEADSISFNVTVGSYTITLNGTKRNLNFTGFSGTVNNTAQTIYGNVNLGSIATFTAGTNAWTFASSSTDRTITTNGKTIDFPLIFNGVGGKWVLQDALTMGSTRALTHTNGTLDLNGKTLTVGSQYASAPGTKNLTFNGGTLICPGASFAFSVSATGFTTTAGTGTGTISLTSASAKSFSGGGATFNCTLNQGGLGALTIAEGGNTFDNITNTVQPASVLFTAGTTTTFNNFNLNGTAGNLISLTSTVLGTKATLSKASGTVSSDYLNITDSAATGGATWNAGANSVDGGNNTGWIFQGVSLEVNKFFLFFN